MLLSVKNTPVEILVNTVFLSHNRQNPANVEFLRCYKCGTGLNQVKGWVGAVYAGYVPSDDVATISRCHNCSENYTFQTQEQNPSATSLILSTSRGVTTFHCLICRTQLMQYTKMGAVLLPDFKAFGLSRPFNCFNPICKMTYLLKDIVEPEVL